MLRNLDIEVIGVVAGSIVYILRLKNVSSAQTLWNLYKNHQLDIVIEEELLNKTEKLNEPFKILLEMKIGVTINGGEYEKCKAELIQLGRINFFSQSILLKFILLLLLGICFTLLGAIAYQGYRDKVRDIQEKIINSVHHTDVIVDTMWGAGVISDEERDTMSSLGSDQEKNVMLLKLIDKNSWCFVNFILALDQSGQVHIAGMLQETGRYC